MNKTIYRIMGIIVTFALALGGFSSVDAVSSQPDVENATSGKPVYAYYYLWWSAQHWKNKLGPNYPYNASPSPLPATTDADGCNPVSSYAGNQLLDVPTQLVSQDEPGAIEADIKLAKNAGLTGFWLNWAGDGTTTQTRVTVTYTRRLAEAFAASKRVGGFKNWVSYKAASREPANYIINDLNFLYSVFKDETAWEKINGKPIVTFTGSREYSDADVQMISNAVRDRMYLVGDESRKTLTPARIAMFDAITYYWSTQDPYGNPQSFEQIKEMGDKVHDEGKKWYAPLNPGYNSILLNTGSCIPRKNGETLRSVWKGNLASKPDGWGFISWNEIAENTHIKPMQKWGSRYLDVLSSLINSSPMPTPAPIGAGMYDNNHSAWVFSGNWFTYAGNGPLSNTMHYTNSQGASASITFTGTMFKVWFTKYPNRGKVEVWIDGVRRYTFNEYGDPIAWQQSWTLPDALSKGTHIVQFKNPNTSTDTYIDIDGIQISNSSVSSATPTSTDLKQIIDDQNAALSYSSSAWQDQVTDQAHGGSYKETTTSGSFVTLPFNGQSFSIIYKGGVTFGKMKVYVDDVLVATLNQKASDTTYQKRWDYPDTLPAGDHILKLVFQSVSSTINKGSLDAVIIR